MMRSETCERLQAQVAKWPEGVVGPATHEEVTAAEKALGASFPADYRTFLLRWGGGKVGSYLIYGIRPLPTTAEEYTVVGMTRAFRSEGWPEVERWIVISDDGRGNPIGIGPDGRILRVDHDAAFEVDVLALNFEDFLLRKCL